MNILYGIRCGYGEYTIVQFEIIKETQKQYKVKEIRKDGWCYDVTVNKNKMSVYSFIFETTLEKAKAKRRELIQNALLSARQDIERKMKRVGELEKMLEE